MKRVLVIALAVLSWAGTATLARAYTPTAEEMPRIRALAQDLAAATDRLYGDASTKRRPGDSSEKRALRSLADLESRSRLFRRQVDLPDVEPAETREEFDQVVAAYTLASSSLNDLNAGPGDLNAFNDVERTMNELTDIYGGQPRYWGRHERSDARMVTLPAGTAVAVKLRSALRSRDLVDGQEINAALAGDVVVSGRAVAASGSDALLRITAMKEAGRVKGREQITFELAGIRVGGAKMQTVDSNEVTLRAEASSGRDAGIIAGGAAAGAVLGALTGTSAAKGAVIGGAAGTGIVLTTRGKTVELPAGYQLDFTLVRPLRIYLPSEQRKRDEQPRDRDNPLGVSRR